MVKFGKIMPFEYNLCLNHAIHLAVIDVVFPKIKKTPISNNISQVSSTSSDDESDYEDEVNDHCSASYEDSLNENSCSEDDESIETVYAVEDKYKSTLKKMRKIVKLFKMSPVSNAVLQSIIQKSHGHKLELKLDVKTRWNSFVIAGLRFLKVKDCIVEALSHRTIRRQNWWSHEDSEILEVTRQYFILDYINANFNFLGNYSSLRTSKNGDRISIKVNFKSYQSRRSNQISFERDFQSNKRLSIET